MGVFTTDLKREFPWQRLDASVPRTETLDGVTIHRLRAFSLPGELHYPFVRGLEKALARDHPEIVHVHTYGTNQAAVARRFSRRTSTPFVLTAHFHPIWSIEGGWLRHRIRGFYDRTLAAPVIASARAVIVQSREEERLLRQTGVPLPHVSIIPPGYTPLPDPTPGDRPFARSLGLSGPFALFAGRLASNKGFTTLLPAFATLSRHDPTASLVLVGEDGGQLARIHNLATQLGIAERVHVVGFVEDEARLAAAFREARVFVLPSEYRGVRPRPPGGARAGHSRHRLPGRRDPGVHRGPQGGLADPSRRGARARGGLARPLGRPGVAPPHRRIRPDRGRPPAFLGRGRDAAPPSVRGHRRPMNVAQVALRFDAPGGVETTVRELAIRLRSKGDSVEVYASDLLDEGRWVRRSDFPASVEGVPVHRFPVYKRLVPGLTMPLMVGLVDALSRAHPQVLHAHSHRYGHVLETALVARSDRIPLVVSTHYHPAHPGESRGKRALLRVQDHLFGMSAYRVARALIVETQEEAKLVAEFAPSDRIRVIPPGIDLDAWQSRATDRPPDGLPPRYLLYAGRIASNKGLPDLVRALAQIPAAERLPLVLVGRDWGARASVEAAAREVGVAADLVWAGHLEDPSQDPVRLPQRGGVRAPVGVPRRSGSCCSRRWPRGFR